MSLEYTLFNSDMKKDYTILVPSMLPIHFRLLTPVFAKSGYKLEVLTNEGEQVREEGLAHVHNDTCYPALLVIGQMIDADRKSTRLNLCYYTNGRRVSCQ